MPASGRGEPEGLEFGGVQPVGKSFYLARDLGHLAPQVLKGGGRGVGRHPGVRAKLLQLDREERKMLVQMVVELARQTAALLVVCGNQPLTQHGRLGFGIGFGHRRTLGVKNPFPMFPIVWEVLGSHAEAGALGTLPRDPAHKSRRGATGAADRAKTPNLS